MKEKFYLTKTVLNEKQGFFFSVFPLVPFFWKRTISSIYSWRTGKICHFFPFNFAHKQNTKNKGSIPQSLAPCDCICYTHPPTPYKINWFDCLNILFFTSLFRRKDYNRAELDSGFPLEERA